MAPPRPQPLRRGLLAAAELRFQLVELRVDGSLVVLPVAAAQAPCGLPTWLYAPRPPPRRSQPRRRPRIGAARCRRGPTWPRRSPRDSARSQPPAMRYARPRRWSRSRPAPTPSRRCRPGRTATRGHSPLAAPISMPSGPPMIAMSRPMSCDSSPPLLASHAKRVMTTPAVTSQARDNGGLSHAWAPSRQWGFLSKAGLRPVA